MKYLIVFTAILWGCNWASHVQSVSLNETPVSSDGCSSVCRQDCGDIFSRDNEFDQCTRLPKQTVTLMKKAVDNMRRGIWNSITEEQMTFLVNISHTPWIKYADSDQESANNMLIWMAENKNIPRYLDDEREVLKTVLASLSPMPFDKGVKDSLSKDVEDGRTFLEMLAWKKNNEGFRKVHQVILDVCNKDEICIRQTYCSNNSDIVPETVNNLKLNLDFQDFDFACS